MATRKPSGVAFLVHVPKSLKALLVAEAASRNQSLVALVNEILRDEVTRRKAITRG